MPLPNLQEPLKLGELTLKNRVVLASLTRDRNGPGRVPLKDNVEYYSQRASAGLILTESALISEQGVEWGSAPGIFTQAQIDGWSKVTAAVHAQGSIIFMQLWHVGRVAHPGMHAEGGPTLSPSGIGARGGKFRLLPGKPGYVKDPEVIKDPWEIIGLYEQAARNAMLAGCDGVEVHCANGYLVHQFLESHSNTRTDEFGGSIENRARFALEAVKAAIRGIGGDSRRVGVKLSPSGGYNDMGDPIDILIPLYTYLVTELDKLNIGYIQFMRYWAITDIDGRGTPVDSVKFFRPLVKNALVMFNGGFTGDEAEEFVKSGKADFISFGIPFIRTPDLPIRLFNGQPLNNFHDVTIMFGAKPGYSLTYGYTDFPRYEEWVKSLTTVQWIVNGWIPMFFKAAGYAALLKNRLIRMVFRPSKRSSKL
ncbi:hypothetical protein BJ742DRAFT_827798 [Cladochytrium replicatum]|nr:hypothetical protein BJ742DRAFT_827798 [Cladochytrium replicatum]